MFIKKVIVVKVVILVLVCVGCTSNNINKILSYTKDSNKWDIELRDESSEVENDEKKGQLKLLMKILMK